MSKKNAFVYGFNWISDTSLKIFLVGLFVGYFYFQKMKCSVFLGLITTLSLALADQETLVLVDNLNIRETHSQFFKSLQGKNVVHVHEPGAGMKNLTLSAKEPNLLLFTQIEASP